MAGTLIATSLALAGIEAAVVAFAVNLVISYAVSQIFAPTDARGDLLQEGGARVQLPPATDNLLPIVYGNAWVRPVIVDAKISTDQKTMWYVCALSEASQSNGIGDLYWNDNLITFDGTDNTKVVSFTDVNGVVDTSPDGYIYIYKYARGSSSGINTGQTAIQILQDAAIDPTYRWTSTDTMSDTTFIIVRLNYNSERGFTGLANINALVQSPVTKPGDAILDYLTNERYGCAIPLARIDTATLTALNTYSDEQIVYAGPPAPSTLARYRFNGVIDPAVDCWSNLQIMAENCDSWLRWSESTGRWGIIINKKYDEAPGSLLTGQLFLANDSNIIGGITLTPTDLNSTYNGAEVQYYLGNNQDKQLWEYVTLATALWNPNEPRNILNFQLPLVNDNRTARYIATRRMFMSREDLSITLAVDWSGIQIEAGDVIRITNTKYGWTEKLFRVIQVVEERGEGTILGVRLTLNEYNGSIYEDIAATYYQPSSNTGISNPNVAIMPADPYYTNIQPYASTPNYTVNVVVPATGLYNVVEFWQAEIVDGILGPFSLLTTVTNSALFANGSVASATITGQRDGIYRTRARVRTTGGIYSDFSGWQFEPFVWTPSKNVLVTNLGFTRSDTGIPPDSVLDTITYGDRWVAIGDHWSTYVEYLYTSTDGVNWTAGTLPVDWTNLSVAGPFVTWNGSYYLAVAYSSQGISPSMTSPDGVTWTYQSGFNSVMTGGFPRGVIWGNGRWMAWGNFGVFATSTDGVNWTDLYTQVNTAGGSGGIGWSSVVWTGAEWYAVGERVSNYPCVIKSTDGLNWTLHTTISHPDLYARTVGGLKSDGTKWIGASGAPDRQWVTTDFTTWTPYTNIFEPTGGAITQLLGFFWSSAKNRWIAIGRNSTTLVGQAAVSGDGITWVEESSIRLLPTMPKTGFIKSDGEMWILATRTEINPTDTTLIAKSTL